MEKPGFNSQYCTKAKSGSRGQPLPRLVFGEMATSLAGLMVKSSGLSSLGTELYWIALSLLGLGQEGTSVVSQVTSSGTRLHLVGRFILVGSGLLWEPQSFAVVLHGEASRWLPALPQPKGSTGIC